MSVHMSVLQARGYDYGFIFCIRAILPWFSHQSIGRVVLSEKEGIGSVAALPLPPLLHSDQQWVGFSLYVAFTLPPGVFREKYCSFHCCLYACEGGVQHHLTLVSPGPGGEKYTHRLLVIHIPRVRFPQELTQFPCINASFKSLTPGLEVEMCGIRVVYEQDLQGLIQTIAHCTLSSQPAAYFGRDDETVMLEGEKIGTYLTLKKSLIEEAIKPR